MFKRLSLFFLFILIVSCSSDDGSVVKKLHWNSAQLDINFEIYGIACDDDGTVIAAGNDGKAARSVDGGDNWAPVFKIAGISNNLNDVAYCNQRFVTVGDNHIILFSLNKGVSWSQSSYAFAEIDYKSLACNGNNILIGGETTLNSNDDKFDNRTALSTNNGADWRSYKVSGVIPKLMQIGINHLMFGSSRYYLATNGGLAGYSSDGITWNKLLIPVNADYNFTGIAQGTDNGTKITLLSAMNQDNNSMGKVVISYNDNISNWYDTGLPATEPYRGVAFGKNLFIAVTDNYVYASDNVTNDNVVWQKNDYPPLLETRKITTVTYCGNAFWIGTDSGQILRALYY